MRKLATVAKKLKLDYAPAMVGWDVKRKCSVPDIQGIVVRKEDENLLVEAFREYTVHRIRKQKIAQRLKIAKRWRKMTNQVFIFRALKQKYL